MSDMSKSNPLTEEGYPQAEPVDSPVGLPPGGGKFAIPHYATFGQVINVVTRTYRWTYDEAVKHSHTNALAIRRDPVVMDALRSRQVPVVQLPWHLEPIDDTDPRQQEAAKELSDIITDIPNFQRYRMHLAEAIWYGRYAVQNIYRWDYSRNGKRRLVVADYRPINGDKLQFKFDGSVGVLVHPTFFNGETEFTDRGRAHFLTPEERQTLVIHKHEPEDADFFEAELGGSIHGVGIRSRIYWLWWLRSQVTAFLMDYLERVGAGGFTIYYFEAGNPASLSEVKEAAEKQWRNNAILFPRYRDGSTSGPGVQRVEPSPAGAQLLESLIVNYFDNCIRRYILGQSLTSEAHGTGLGSGLADLHADTFNRIVKYDAVNVQETLKEDLLKVLSRYNFPGIPCPRFVFDVDKPNAGALLDAAKSFYEMGGQIDADELGSIIGLSKPQPGHAILAQVPALSPAGVGASPQGIPMEGPLGPVPQGQAQGQEQQGQPYLFEQGGDKVKLAASTLDTPAATPVTGEPEPATFTPGRTNKKGQTKEELASQLPSLYQRPFLKMADYLDDEEFWGLHKKNAATLIRHIISARPAEASRAAPSNESRGAEYQPAQNPEANTIAEMAHAGRIGREWYTKVPAVMKQLFPQGNDAKRFVGFLAATSPNTPVEQNFRVALDYWHAWNTGTTKKYDSGEWTGKPGWHDVKLSEPRPSDPATAKKFIRDLIDTWKGNADNIHAEQGYQKVFKRAYDSRSQKTINKVQWRKDGKDHDLPIAYVHLSDDPESFADLQNTDPKRVGSIGGSSYVSSALPVYTNSYVNNLSSAMAHGDDDDWTKLRLSPKTQKVDSFYLNLLSGFDKATKGLLHKGVHDTWMGKLFGLPTQRKIPYYALNAITRRAADVLNQTPETRGARPWTAAEIQSSVWMFMKGLGKIAAEKETSAQEALADLTHGNVSEAADFIGEVFSNAGLQARLRRLLGASKFNRVAQKISAIDKQVLAGTPQKSERVVEGGNPVLERIARTIGQQITEPYEKGRIKRAASDSLLSLSPHLKGLMVYLAA